MLFEIGLRVAFRWFKVRYKACIRNLQCPYEDLLRLLRQVPNVGGSTGRKGRKGRKIFTYLEQVIVGVLSNELHTHSSVVQVPG